MKKSSSCLPPGLFCSMNLSDEQMEKDSITVRTYHQDDRQLVVQLVAGFRVALSEFRGRTRKADLSRATAELQEYVEKAYPIFVAVTEDEPICIGYVVCRIDDDTVWVESLFVSPEFRRRGVAGLLYDAAEECARAHGQDTLYNWIHPNNHAMIGFLEKRGYDVLNLIEVRRRRNGEEAMSSIRVGDHDFAY